MSEWQVHTGDWRDVLPRLEAEGVRVDAVVTDPPYGISFAAQPTKWQRRAGQRPEQWDDEAPDVSRLLTLAPIVAVWGGNYFDLPPSRGWMIWTKPDAPPSMGQAEMCWTNRDTNTRHIVHSIAATNPERVGHPTQKPVRVMQWCLETLGVPDGGVVLDPFCGSGSTGVACLRTGRKFIGIEIEPRYAEIARRRCEREAAQPMLIGAGA